jgi:cytochrome c oxidase subunit 2
MTQKAVPTFAIASPLIVVLLTGCAGSQSALDPASLEAVGLTDLIVGFSALLAIIWLAVIALGIALRRRQSVLGSPEVFAQATDSVANRRILMLAVATGVTVLVLTFASFAAQRKVSARPDAAVHIKLTGHQWWWQVEYLDPKPSRRFETANEIHLPAGATVTVDLDSRDVIHSFWVPNLTGKKDLIPGRPASISFTPTRTGTFRAQCAEFCGLQHAHMALIVTVEDKDHFDAWSAKERAPADDPGNDSARRGRDVFTHKACIMCHSIKGTDAGSQVGPDLTHLASRPTVAAGALPFTRGTLAAWIADPQGIKPGAEMPIVALEPDELNALLDYLMGLK